MNLAGSSRNEFTPRCCGPRVGIEGLIEVAEVAWFEPGIIVE